MKRSEINEYVQTIAAVFAIAGIVFVGVQVKQSNRFAETEFIADFYDAQINLRAMAIDSDVYATVAKSIENPTELSLEELLELDAYYDNRLLLIDKVFKAGSALGILDDATREYQLEDIRSTAKELFPGAFARKWIENSNFYRSGSPIRAALLEGLNDPSIEAIDVRLMRTVEASQR